MVVRKKADAQNYSLSVIEHLFKANEQFFGGEKAEEQFAVRLSLQQEAMTELRLAYMRMIAREAQCILPKPQSHISMKIVETQRLLYAWMKSGEIKSIWSGIPIRSGDTGSSGSLIRKKGKYRRCRTATASCSTVSAITYSCRIWSAISFMTIVRAGKERILPLTDLFFEEIL